MDVQKITLADYEQYTMTRHNRKTRHNTLTAEQWKRLKGELNFGRFWKNLPQNTKEESHENRNINKEPCHIDMADKTKEVST